MGVMLETRKDIILKIKTRIFPSVLSKQQGVHPLIINTADPVTYVLTLTSSGLSGSTKETQKELNLTST